MLHACILLLVLYFYYVYIVSYWNYQCPVHRGLQLDYEDTSVALLPTRSSGDVEDDEDDEDIIFSNLWTLHDKKISTYIAIASW